MPDRPTDSNATVALLTPPGRGAIAVLALRASDVRSIMSSFFIAFSGRTIGELPCNRPIYGTWNSSDDYREDLIIWIRNDQSAEIHCHGGHIAWKQIADDLEAKDVEVVDWKTQTAAESHSLERQAEDLLVEAKTAKCAAILLDQVYGALTRELELIEALIRSSQTKQAIQHLVDMHERCGIGAHLTEPWKIALVGKPNVGKSSLVNALLGFERAIVFDQPGTTRDVISDQTAIAGWPIEFFDTVGLRETANQIEVSGIAQTEAILTETDLAIVIDDSAMQTNEFQFADSSTAERSILVRSKIDLTEETVANGIVPTSAKTNQGIELLLDRIAKLLVPREPRPGQAVPFTAEATNGNREMYGICTI